MKYLSSCQLLSEEFERRKSRNPSYSLRAFARDLGVGKTTISDVVNGVRRLSVQNIEIVAAKLGLSEEVVQALKADLTLVSEQPREVLLGHELSIIENWYYLAILNLAKLSYSECSAEWISKRLDLPLDVAANALQLLMEKGHIENRDGKMVRVSKLLSTTQNVPSSAIAEHHKQSIEKALEAIEDVPVDKRDFTAVTYAVKLDKLEEAKELILNFHRKLGKLLETDSAEEVYRLNIQFFPLTKISENTP